MGLEAIKKKYLEAQDIIQKGIDQEREANMQLWEIINPILERGDKQKATDIVKGFYDDDERDKFFLFHFQKRIDKL